MNAAVEQATAMQRRAAGPDKSVFVSANAGSGKTRVLVDRVSRILLSGTDPDKILCLTYTKAAASEMQERLFAALGKWSIIEAGELNTLLNKLEGTDVNRGEDELGRARRLFARALETPGGLKVQTIHAFCERLLKRFPLEAGLLPGTEAIDEREAAELHLKVMQQMQIQAQESPENDIAKSISLLAARRNDSDIEALFSWMMGNAFKIDKWAVSGGVSLLAKKLGIDRDASADELMAAAWAEAPKVEIKQAAGDMMSGGITDAKKANNIHAALTVDTPQAAYQLYESIFFTQAGKPAASIVTGKAGEFAIALFGTKKTGPCAESLRMMAACDQIKAVQTLGLTQAVYTLAVEAVAQYRALKKRMRVMDFDDQIHLAHALLTDKPARDWVRYKLDGGVDHVLVDEAQDTSDAQWDIIDALSEEFFQPSPDRDPRLARTLFAVGDEKQSIYSFQGARPEVFLAKIKNLRDKQKQTPDVRMSMSFRSAPQVLSLVDQIYFEDGGIHESFAGDVDGDGSHAACREDCGLVEFWPASKAPDKPEEEIAWKPVPVDAPESQSTREQLAREIAKQVKTWINTGEPVYDRTLKVARPMQARDIMILVTKRLPFFDAIIRNLKVAGVPVAGADRLMLTESIAVQDLLSLAKFTQLPSDDLSLAEVLKSPLFGWSDDQLFDVAHNRGGQSLWQALPDGPDKRLLHRIRALAGRYAPYEFFARTLALSPKGESLLQKIFNRIGIEAADALDAFLARALAHQRRGAPSLARFVSEIETDENKIKREMDTAQNEVRVMTVHAAKGLEAPVVILPDTTTLPTVSKEKLYPAGDGFVMNVKTADRPAAMEAIVDEALAGVLRENMRLLYVALTRAESRLLVCGFESHKKVKENSWHARVERALGGLQNVEKVEMPFGEGLRYGRSATAAEIIDLTKGKPDSLPSFLREPAQIASKVKQRVSPSKLVKANEFDVPVRSPLQAPDDVGQGRFGRGNIIHKLLQILPDLPVEDRHNAARHFLQNQRGIDAAQIEIEVFAVLEHPEYAPFFAPGSQAEMALAGSAKDLPSHIELNGQIDRLSVQGDIVWIIDYKSNRPPPMHEENVSEIYIRQMAAYRAIVRELYPGKRVKCALLWTDGPRLMTLSSTILDNVNWESVLPA